MSDPQPSRPLSALPIASAGPSPSPSGRHDTQIPDEPDAAVTELSDAMAAADRRTALAALVARRPAFLEGWARLGEELLAPPGDVVSAYACARVAYHRGLDQLRRHGWGGTGTVRWSHPGNRGFLRGVRLLLVSAAALGELDESTRCREFLLDLDPDDGLGARGFPAEPGPGWVPPPPPP